MPALVFPAPGCESGKQFLMPFQGFDISHDTGGTFSNLLTNSVDLTKSEWIRGVDNQAVLGESQFDIVEDYINEPSTVPYQPIYAYKNDFGEHTIVSSSSTQYYGQQITVLPSTSYTFSFYAKRGTATNTTYGVYNATNSIDIVSATSYYANTSSTLWSRISTTFNTGSATTINVYVLWNIATGVAGSVNIFGPQLDLGASANPYDPTSSISWAVQGLTTVEPQSYGRSQLASFSDSAKDFEPLAINGQSSARWRVVNDYIFDNPTLTYSSAGTNNVLSIPEQTTRPYQVGDTVTVANSNTGYRQNFQVTAFTDRSLTINTTSAVPVNGSFVINPAPQVYPQSLTSVAQYRTTNVARENLFAVTFAPNLRGVEYFLDRDFVTTSALLTVSKVLPRTNVHTPVDRRTIGKVLPRTNVHTPVDRRTLSRTETLTATGERLISRFPNGMPSLSGINLFLLQDRTTADVTLTTNSFRLESFDNQGIYPGDTFNITGQNNITNNSVNQYIYDLDVLSVTVSANGAQQTLYFNTNPNGYNSVNYFPVGFYARITDSIANTSYIVQITASTASSITFNTISSFPNRIGGTGLTVQSATSFVYPKTTVDSNMYSYISANGINLYNYPTNPRENLSVSEFKPNFRPATKFSIDNSLSDTLPTVYPTLGKMATFEAGIIPGDFKITVTGQSADTVNNAVTWYGNELDILTVTSVVSGLKTAFFPVQDAVPYPSGSQVRLVNTQSSFNQIITVVTGTSNSISFNGTMPLGSTTIERVVSSVYPQQYVSTTTAPTTPRENLFYSTLAVGYRSNSSITQGKLFATDNNVLNTSKLNAASVVRSVVTVPTSNTLEKRVTALRSTTSLPAVSKLSSAIKVQSDRASFAVHRINELYQQSSVVITSAPTNARENLYYFILAPGYRANSSIVQGKLFVTGDQPLPINNLNKQLAVLKTDRATLSVSKLQAAQILKTDSISINTSLINKLIVKSNSTQVFYTPYTDKLSQGFVVRSDRTTISADNLVKQIFMLKPDQTRLFANKLSSVAVLRTDTTKLNADKLDLFKVRFDTTEVFETPRSDNLERQLARLTSGDIDFAIESINKQLSILKSDQSILTTNKLSSAVTVKSDNTLVLSNTIEKPLVPIGYNDIVNYSLLDRFIVKSNATEVFSVPNSDSLRNGLVVRDLGILPSTALLVNKGFVVRAESATFEPTLIDKLKVPASKSQIFDKLEIGKLSAVIVVRQSTETARVGRLSAAVKVIAEQNTLSVYSTDNYTDQRIFNNLNPNNSAMAKFQYFNIAPGFRYNRSIQQGLTYEPPAAKVRLESLATFDNEGLISIIPKSTVSTNVAPTTPREYLYYAELARGYKYGVLNTVFGSSLSDESPVNIKTQFLEKDYYRLKGLVDPDTVRNLELQLFKLVPPNKQDLVIEFLDPVKFKDFKNQVFYVDTGGQIIRFKTGDFKRGSRGIVDVAAPKKEPIQFWN
jgi:hypothetical protein